VRPSRAVRLSAVRPSRAVRLGAVSNIISACGVIIARGVFRAVLLLPAVLLTRRFPLVNVTPHGNRNVNQVRRKPVTPHGKPKTNNTQRTALRLFNKGSAVLLTLRAVLLFL